MTKYWGGGGSTYDEPFDPEIGGARAPRGPWSRRLCHNHVISLLLLSIDIINETMA